MLHERDIVAVVAPQFLQIVAEALAPAEELLEAGETAAERVTPRVDNRGTGEHQGDETGASGVAVYVVDEARLVGEAVRLRARQVARGEAFDFMPVERGDRLQECGP